MGDTKNIRVLDLFCGCGGLSLGFEAYSGPLSFETILGIDIEPSAIRLYNDNFFSKGDLPLGRVADVTWFTHPSEIRLFYLTHFAYAKNDRDLKQELSALGLESFLLSLKNVDQDFESKAHALSSSDSYRDGISQVHKATFNLALVKGITAKLGISSFTKPIPSLQTLAWTEEYSTLPLIDSLPNEKTSSNEEILQSATSLWSDSIHKIQEASTKKGRGQNANNAVRLRQLYLFLTSSDGQSLQAAWSSWKSERDTLRAEFCLRNSEKINELYKARRVHLVLGGPPCKGFSRIGRPVIESLRDQGVHAWSHHEFGDERNALMIQYVLFLEALRPDIFLFENVSNFKSTLKTPGGSFDAPELLEELIEELSADDLHYHIAHKLVNAKDFNVPQDRRRFIMFGVNTSKCGQEVASEFFYINPPSIDVNLEAALWGLGKPAEFQPGGDVRGDFLAPVHDVSPANMQPEYRDYWIWIRQNDPRTQAPPSYVDAHIYRRMREDDAVFLRYVAPGIRWMDLKAGKSESLNALKELLSNIRKLIDDRKIIKDIEAAIQILDDSFMLRVLLEHISNKYKLSEQHLLQANYLKNGNGQHGDWFERLSPSKPCKTIVAHIGKDTYGYFHPYENRAITIREAARIQSFPDWFQLRSAGVVDTYTAIGNAVPPLMANKFADKIALINEKYKVFDEKHTTASKRTNRIKQIALNL